MVATAMAVKRTRANQRPKDLIVPISHQSLPGGTPMRHISISWACLEPPAPTMCEAYAAQRATRQELSMWFRKGELTIELG